MLLRHPVLAAAVLLSCASGAFACTSAGDLCLNEVQTYGTGSPSARRATQYLELRGPAGASIASGTYLVAVDGDRNQNPGTIDVVIDLSGKSLGSNGFLVLLAQGNGYTVDAGASSLVSTASGFSGISGWSGNTGAVAFERPSTSFFLVSAASAPTPGTDIDTVGSNDGVPDGSVFAGWSVLDSVAIADNSSDKTYAALNFRPNAGSTGTTVVLSGRTWYAGRFGDSFGSTAGAWVASSNLGGSNPNYLLSTTAVSPVGVGGKPLNHVGATNLWANLAPVNVLPSAPGTNEDQSLMLTLGVSDGDAGTASLTQQLSVDVGTLSLGGTAGLTFDAGADHSASMTITGSLAALNNALNGLTFVPPANFNGSATLSISTNDNGNTGSDGAKSDSDTIALTITAVNDAPSFSVGANQTVASDAGVQSVPMFATALSAGPADESGQPLDFIVSNDANGLFTTQPAIAADGSLSYTPAASFTGTATVTVQIHDGGGTGNGGVDTSASQTFTITTTAPSTPATVTTIVDNDADDLLPLNGTVTFDVNFSRNVDGASAAAGDFSFTGTATATIDSVTIVDSDTVQVGATATAGGTLVLSLSGEVLDTFAMAVTTAADDTTLTVDAIAPTLVSVVRETASPTNAATVDFTFTFSEDVGTVDFSDFELGSTGVTGAFIGSLNGLGSVWTVNVNTGTGDGAVSVGLAAGMTLQDNAGNVLVPSTLSAMYTIDRTAPLPVGITKLDSDNPTIPYVRWQIEFDEAVTGVGLGDFGLIMSGGIDDAMIIGVSGAGTTWVVDVYTGLHSGTLSLRLFNDDAIIDIAGNVLGAGLDSPTYTIDAQALIPVFKDGFETPPGP